MGVFKKFGAWAKKTAKKGASFVAKNAGPILGVAAGLALPVIGGGLGKAVGSIGAKLKGAKDKLGSLKKEGGGIFGIGDGKPGIFGIGDGKPGVFGIGTGHDRDARLKREMELRDEYEAKKAENAAVGLPPPPMPAELKKTNPLIWVGAALAGLFILKK